MTQLVCEIIALLTIVLGLVLILGCAVGPAVAAVRPLKHSDVTPEHHAHPHS